MYGEELELIGKKLVSVSLSEGNIRINFEVEGGPDIVYEAEGDCCSSSWIEHLELPGDIKGATVTAIDDSGYVDATLDSTLNPLNDQGDNRSYECLQVYHTTFRTDRGDIVLEYRNSSNGYYGGSLRRV